MEPPVVIPLAELTACQQLVSTWVEAHLTTLLVVGALAVLGGLVVMNAVVRVSMGLTERILARVRAPKARVY